MVSALLHRWFVLPLAGVAACGSSVEVEVQLVNPCNRDVLTQVEFLRFEPRGENIDSQGLARVEPIASGSTQIPVTPAVDFRLVVTGIKGTFDGPVTAAGVSGKYDLVNADGPVSIRVAMAPIDDLYRTTDLAEPSECTALKIARYGATATLVPSTGVVVVLGGATVSPAGTVDYKRTIEAFDPATGLFSTIGELPFGGQRAFHTATLLADDRILVVGGEAHVQDSRSSLKSALLVDARDLGTVQVTTTPSLRDERTGHVAIRLADGRVMIAGGRRLNPAAGQPTDHFYQSSVEIYDPARGLFVVPSGAGGLSQKRYGHTGTLLKTGKDVLIAGGFNEAGPVPRPEVVHVTGTEITVRTASAAMGAGVIFHAAALTEGGQVLVSGGYNAIADAEPSGGLPRRPSAVVEGWELKQPSGDLVPSCRSDLQVARGYHSLSVVGQRAIFIGGRDDSGATTKSVEVASVISGQSCFAALPAKKLMADSRAQQATALLPSGEILVVGGLTQTSSQPLWTSIGEAEVFSPARAL